MNRENFKTLKTEDLLALERVGDIKLYKKGDVVFKKDDPSFYFAIVVDGEFTVNASKTRKVALNRGMLVGELGALSSKARGSDVVCSESGALLTIMSDSFFEEMFDKDSSSSRILLFLCLHLIDKIK